MTPVRVDGDWLRAPQVQAVFAALEAQGHPAWCVGGCVRNALLGVPVADVDLSTPALPEAVMAAAEAAGLKPVPTGIAHGTITVVSDGEPVEVTTFRRDVCTDGRRAVVAFAMRMEEDAVRRDFTMNALYADRHGAVTDPLGGLADLRRRRVRFIFRAEDRIREDYLRILRFFRFHAWYGDPAPGLDPEGLAASKALAEGIAGLSKERIGAEFKRLLAAPDPGASVAAMAQAGVLARVLADADAAALPQLLELETRLGIAPRWERRLAALVAAPPAQALRLSGAETRALSAIAAARASGEPPAARGYRFGAEAARDALLIEAAGGGGAASARDLAAAARGAVQRFPLAAADLIDRYGPSPALGQALRRLETRWVASGFSLDAAELIALDAAD